MREGFLQNTVRLIDQGWVEKRRKCVLDLSIWRDCERSRTNEGVCGSASQVERPGVNGVPPEMVRASDNSRPMATNRTKRPAVGIPASQPACNFLESRPPALVHMGPSLNTCCLSSPCSHFVIRERSNIEAVKKTDQENALAL